MNILADCYIYTYSRSSFHVQSQGAPERESATKNGPAKHCASRETNAEQTNRAERHAKKRGLTACRPSPAFLERSEMPPREKRLGAERAPDALRDSVRFESPQVH